jgi:hypothetical protein
MLQYNQNSYNIETNSLVQICPSEVIKHSINQEILRILWNTRVHFHVRKSLSLVPSLSQLNQIVNFPRYFLKFHFNIILSAVCLKIELAERDMQPIVYFICKTY